MKMGKNSERRIYVSATMDYRSRLRCWWLNLRLAGIMQHIGLFITLMAYTIFGGMMFRYLEHPAETARLSQWSAILKIRREHLVETIVNGSSIFGPDPITFKELIIEELQQYEGILQDAFSIGFFSDNLESWTILKSVFFSSTVLTTIGYGNVVPVTSAGRTFCIIFAFVGIPLTLTVIADMGKLFASSVSMLMHYIPPLPLWCRNATIARRTFTYALAAVCFLFIYLALGAALFVLWEDDWTFFDGFYFCFITMTTIGFGDLVPKKPKYMLLCTLYILIGLALTSTIIELVRRQYLQSWRQLQAMSGPLTETLRKIAENAPGLDVTAFQNDLRKVLTVVTMPKRTPRLKRRKDNIEQEWEEAVEAVIRDITVRKPPPSPLVQIVIYESSV